MVAEMAAYNAAHHCRPWWLHNSSCQSPTYINGDCLFRKLSAMFVYHSVINIQYDTNGSTKCWLWILIEALLHALLRFCQNYMEFGHL